MTGTANGTTQSHTHLHKLFPDGPLTLDQIDVASATISADIAAITAAYLAECEAGRRFDWRHYMVKYPAMRDNGSSTYFDSEHLAMGYSLCMLKAGGRALNGYYRDPYLLAIARELAPEQAEAVEDKWFAGGAELPRRLPLSRIGTAVRCVTEGFELAPPPAGIHSDALVAACEQLGVGADMVLPVPQAEVEGHLVDERDRIQIGADVIRQLVAAGL